ncbi:MAG: phosphotransferase [Bacteroidetes bacterium]|nr:phosphotransferase [Bacteroidota bacterium]
MDNQIEQGIKKLFREWAFAEAENIVPLPLAGSSRRYFRVSGGDKQAIATWNEDLKENKAFLDFSRHFDQLGLAVPAIYGLSANGYLYLQEDLGAHSLYKDLPADGETFGPNLIEKYKLVLAELARIQILGDKDLPYESAYPAARFDRTAMRWDLDYFKYFYLKLQEVPFDEAALEQAYNALLDWLMEAPAWYFMLRDCQSRNVIFQGGKPYFIDYQGGRKGPVAYDVASLLWQAKAQMPAEVREQLLDYYMGEVQQYSDIDKARFRKSYYGFVLLRTLQVLGAYGFRGLVQKKPHFIQSIPFALENARWLFAQVDFPVDVSVIEEALSKTYNSFPMPAEQKSTDLTVRITSFSYKRGLPEDPSGNGGGYIFDCRPLLNPGRFEEYKPLTGLNAGVQQFLKEKSGIGDFLEPVFTLVDRAVDTYLEREFTDLQVSFGCTGGQHRSVFSAEQLAARLAQREGVTVELKHRERSFWPENQA